MANSLSIYLAFFSLILSIFCRNLLYSYKPQDSTDDADWINTSATWYGLPYGAGTGSCENDSEALHWDLQWEPYNSLTAAAAYPSLKKNPFQITVAVMHVIRCSPSQNCSGNPVVVTAIAYSPIEGHSEYLFDLSGCSIAALANPGKADQIFNRLGFLDVQYKRCKLVDVDVTFKVSLGSNETYFETSVECGNGAEIAAVEVRQGNSSEWIEMAPVGSANFAVGFNETYMMPLSFKMKTNNSHIVVVKDAIPINYTWTLPYVLKTVWSPVSSSVSLAACQK